LIDARSEAALSPLERLERRVAWGVRNLPPARVSGAVVEISMSHYRVAGLSRFLKLGECVGVDVGDRVQIGEVVRIDDASATLKPFDARSDVTIGARAYRADNLSLSPHRSWKGRVIDALGRPIDGAGELASGDKTAPLDAAPSPPLQRGRVHAPLRTGVRVVHLFTPLCLGQRVGVFAGSGIGKSSLLGMLARAAPIDTVVIALVGERGREVREFLHDTLGDDRASVVTVVSTGDESAMMRRLAPKTAMAIAEYFRDQGESEWARAIRPRQNLRVTRPRHRRLASSRRARS
jgi:flagellum-specific ATP synthase